uniref:hypothetical protein n=1 Tax=uncultured Mailhella sp. TaxID=1981031 RepID=UPI002623FC91
EVWEWVRQGRNLFENPWPMYDESGWPMDFISASRAANEVTQEHERRLITGRQHRKEEVIEYLAQKNASSEERQEAWAWVRKGEDLFLNPWLMDDESGCPMDFISALRELNELSQEHGK